MVSATEGQAKEEDSGERGKEKVCINAIDSIILSTIAIYTNDNTYVQY